VLPVHKKGDKTDSSNYQGMSLLSTSFKIISNILLGGLSPYAAEIIGDDQCGIGSNSSTTDQVLYIQQDLEIKWEYNGTVNHLLIHFKESYDSIRREELYNPMFLLGGKYYTIY
jgi:hypothetical protein